MKALLCSLIGIVSAFNHPDPYRGQQQQFHQPQQQEQFPLDVPIPPPEEIDPTNFPQRIFEEVDPQDVLPPPVVVPSRHQEERIYTRTKPQHDTHNPQHLLEKPPPTVVQGTSVQTWTFLPEHEVYRLQVDLTTQGRPMEALVELWQGPTNVPQKLRVYTENGKTCPFSTCIEIPCEYNTLAVKNIANLQFPLGAIVVDADSVQPNYGNSLNARRAMVNSGRIIQGNAMKVWSHDRHVVSVQVVLSSDGGPICARIELTQGPSNTKQFMDVYSQDGMTYPISLVLETPGVGKVVQIYNTADPAFPIQAWVEPCTKSNEEQPVEVVRDKVPIRHRLPEDLGANGHDHKSDAVDIEFQKEVATTKPRQLFTNGQRNSGGGDDFLPYFWAKSGGMQTDDDLFPPTNGLHP